MDEREVQNFREEIDKTTEELEGFGKALKTLSPALIRLADPTAKFGEEINKATKVTKDKSRADTENIEAVSKQTRATKENVHVTEALTEAQEELNESTKELKKLYGTLRESALDFSASVLDAALDTKQEFSKYGDAVGTAGDAAFEIGKQFGVLGTVIGALVKGMSIAVQQQLKLVDSSLKAYDSMSKIGAASDFTTEELQKLTWGTGRTMENFEKLLKPMQSAGKALVTLGADSAEGAKEFVKLTTVSKETREAFRRLGISEDELTQGQADYLALQRLSGRTFSEQYKTSGELKKASLEYVLNLQELSKITGEDIETTKKQLEIANGTAQMAIINNQQTNKRLNLEKQLETATGQEREQIQKQIDLIKKQQDAMEDVNQAMVGLGQADTAGAMQQFLQTGTISEEMAERFQNLGIDLEKYRKQYESGTLNAGEFMNEYAEKYQERMNNFSDAALRSGKSIEEYNKMMGFNTETTRKITAARENNVDFEKQLAESRQKNLDKMSSQDDKYVEARNKTVEAEKEAQLNTEKALADNIDPTLNAMPALAQSAAEVTKYFDMLADALKVIVGVTGIYAMAKGAKAAAGAFSKAKDYLGKFGKGPPTTPTVPPAPSGTPPLVGKDGKPLRGAALKSAQAKAAKTAAQGAATVAPAQAAKAATQTTGPVAAKAAKVAAQGATTAAPAATAATGAAAKSAGMLGKAAKAAGKFAKFIPGVGLAASVASGAMDAYSAASNAEETLGLEKGKTATTGQKVAAGAAGALSGMTFGLVDQKTIGGFINKTLGLGEDDKLEDLQKKKIDLEIQREKLLSDKALHSLGVPLEKFGKNISPTNDALKHLTKTIENLDKQIATIGKGPAGSASKGGGGSSGAGGAPARPAPASSASGGGSAAPSTGGGFFSKVGQMLDSGAGLFREPSSSSSKEPEKETQAAGGGMSMSEQDIKNMIVEHEGIRYSPYKDSLGLWTVGVGHLIGDGKSLPASWNREFSHDEVMNLFEEDYKHHRQAAERIPGFAKLDTSGQGALTDLTFNMGPTWYKKWPRFSKAIEEGDTQLAALSLEQSKWYGQVGRRAPKIVDLVENAKVSAREGGLAKGPEKGYPAKLHGNEIIVPLDPNSILAELGKKSSQQMMSEMKEKAPEVKSVQSDGIKDLLNMNQGMMEMLANKLDTMINKLDTGNDTQNKILKYTQA